MGKKRRRASALRGAWSTLTPSLRVSTVAGCEALEKGQVGVGWNVRYQIN